MKKLMFIATAALCGAVMAEGEIVSANIVGYATTNLVVGQQAMGAQFLSVGTNGCWLTEIVPSTSAAKILGTVTIQTLTTAGKKDKLYKYYKGAPSAYATEGWYVETTSTRVTKANDVFFKAGTGLWIKGIANSTMTTSGEVAAGDVTIPLIVGQQMLANPFPCDTKLTKVKITTSAAKILGTVTIQTLTSAGKKDKLYKYYKGAPGAYATEGWYVETTSTRVTDANDVTIPGGLGIWVKGVSGATLTFTKPY